MAQMPDLETMLKMMAQVQQGLATSLAEATDPQLKQHLAPLVEDWRNHESELAQLYPKTVQDIETRRQRLMAEAEELQRAADEWHARIDAMEAEAARQAEATAQAAAATPVAPPVTPSQGPVVPEAAPGDGNDGSVWKDDQISAYESAARDEPSQIPAIPRPRAKKAPRPGFDPNQSVRDFDEE